MSVPVSVVIPIKNEAEILPRSLDSVNWADEVFVVDSQSTDGSEKIAEKAGAEVVQFDFKGTWPKKKNWALENLPFKYEWVFFLDADEVLPPEAEPEIRGIVSNPDETHAGYWINRRFMFMGKWLKHAYYPNWNLRFFKHRLGRYEKLTDGDTQSGDNEVHEHVVVKGSTGRLKAEMDHYAFPSVETFVNKHNQLFQLGSAGRSGSVSGRIRGGAAERRCRRSSEAEALEPGNAFPASAAISLHLFRAARIPRWLGGLLLCPSARLLRVPQRGQNL